MKLILTICLAVIILGVGDTRAQTSGFTYQGKFEDATVPRPTNGTYDMEFALFDSVSGGAQIGSTLPRNGVQIANGIFSVSLDFGSAALDGSERFLEIRVFDSSTSELITLSPRNVINSTPYAVRSNQATSADNANNVGNKTAAEVVSTVNDVQAATANNVTGSLVRRGGSGAINVGNLSINGVPITAGANTLVLGTTTTQIRLGVLPGGGVTELCVLTTSNLIITACSSSLRYKKDVLSFSSGMSIIDKLKPISYTWKLDGSKDTGFGAEAVEKIDPMFVSYNQKGEVEGVRYNRLSTVFVNAFKEQQAEIETLKKDKDNLRRQLDGLKQLVCSTNAEAAICKEN